MAPNPQQDQTPTPDHAEEHQGTHSHSDSGSTTQVPVTEKARSEKTKKGPTSKIFSDEDVIRLLKRLAVFWTDGKNNKWAEFHKLVENDLSKKFTKIQVSEKIRSLKKKFVSLSERAQLTGGRIDLPDPHESAVFELSKALWGDEMMSENEEKTEGSKKRKQVRIEGDEPNTMILEEDNKILSKGKGKVVDEHGERRKKKKKDSDGNQKEKMEIGVEEFKSKYPLLCESFKMYGFPKVRIEEIVLIGRENAEALEKKWRELNAELLRLDLKRIGILNPKPPA